MEIVIAILLVALIAVIVWGIVQSRQTAKRQADLLQSQLNEGVTKAIGERLDSSLGHLSEQAGKMLKIGESISSLQEILRAPKARGGIGELFLSQLLEQVLAPSQYELQYSFKNRERVDAVVKLGNSLVPVDSKFPLESFEVLVRAQTEEEQRSCQREFRAAVKTHINNVAKYIRPDEGTFDFALMYIPAENVYYEAFIKDTTFAGETSLCSYALSRRVIPVSPTSFFAYLQAIVLGLKGMRIEESAREIVGTLGAMERDFKKFQENFAVLGGHLQNALKKYGDSDAELKKLDARLSRVLSARESTPQLKERNKDEETI